MSLFCQKIKKNTVVLFCVVLLCHQLLFSLKAKEYIILRSRNCGLFSNFDDVLSLCKFYDKDLYYGIRVDFGKSGLYYDEKYGRNWWNYYCEPICLGAKKHRRMRTGHYPWETELRTSREEAFRLIQKYIFVKRGILDEVDQFCKECFSSEKMIGLHYRGTDKSSEAPRISYEKMTEQVFDKITKEQLKDYKIFVATDENAFLDYMISIFGHRICFKEGAIRSTNGKPIHYKQPNPYQCGREALVDALILSRCDLLIRTSSNLSRWSTYFNPIMPVYEVSKRYDNQIK